MEATLKFELADEGKLRSVDVHKLAPKPSVNAIHHPLQKLATPMENALHLRNLVGGSPQGEKLKQELKSAAQFNRGPPGFSTASRLHFDLLLSRDDRIEYGDYLKYGEPY